jgi:hypothetical protein
VENELQVQDYDLILPRLIVHVGSEVVLIKMRVFAIGWTVCMGQDLFENGGQKELQEYFLRYE